MIKVILGTTLLAMSTFGHNVVAAQPYPTNGIYQEMSGTTAEGKTSIDLLNSSNFRDSVRLGMFGGEIIYTPNAAGASSDMLGYKHPFNMKMAAYGLINFDTADNNTDLLLGFAYSGGDRSFMYNFNAEIFSPGGGGDNTMEIKAGGYYAIVNRTISSMYRAGELVMDLNNDTTSIFAAMRFVPRENIHVDVGVFQSDGGGGGSSRIGIPLFFRLTLGI